MNAAAATMDAVSPLPVHDIALLVSGVTAHQHTFHTSQQWMQHIIAGMTELARK
jgi:hypothetical protein